MHNGIRFTFQSQTFTIFRELWLRWYQIYNDVKNIGSYLIKLERKRKKKSIQLMKIYFHALFIFIQALFWKCWQTLKLLKREIQEVCICNLTTINVAIYYRGNSVETKIFDVIRVSNKSRLMFLGVFFWTKPHPNACTVYFAVLLALKHGIDALQMHSMEHSASPLLETQGVPFLGQVEERM